MDNLEEIFKMQETLNARIGVNLKDLNDEEKGKWVLNYTRAMQQELAELIDSVPWKWWAKYQNFDALWPITGQILPNKAKKDRNLHRYLGLIYQKSK